MTMKFHRRGILAGATLLSAVLFSSLVSAEDAVTRLPLENSTFPISAEVTVNSGSDIYFLSGAVPPMTNKDAPAGSTAAYGDMETQATNALTAIKGTLGRLGLEMGDVVKMTAFLVADPATGKLDFAGFMKGYTKFFGTADQPHLPSRSAVQIAALVAPGALVEIEVTAAKAHVAPKKAAAKASK
jgi:enamine deaminase RidA (YjgF/YER057c/UK114 family)